MQKKEKAKWSAPRLWKGPCLTTFSLLMLTGLTAALIQRGLLGTENMRPALLLSSLLAGVIAPAATEREQRKKLAALLSPGIPALILIAAILLGRGGGKPGWSVACALLLLLPTVCVSLTARKRHRSGAGRKRPRR